MKKVFADYWNLWGGIIIATVIAWFYDFEKVKMDTFASYVILVLTFIGVLTFIKSLVDKKKQKLAFKITPIKAMNVAINPTGQGEEIAQTINDTIEMIKKSEGVKISMKKIKNFFVKLWGNKVTLGNILINLAIVGFGNFMVFSDKLSRYAIYQEHNLLFKILVPILSVLYTLLDFYASVNKRGWENLDELNAISEQKKIEKLSQLTSEQKKLIKDTISALQIQLDELLTKFKKYTKSIENYRSLQALGIQTDASMRSYNEAVAFIENNRIAKEKLETQIAQLKEKLH